MMQVGLPHDRKSFHPRVWPPALAFALGLAAVGCGGRPDAPAAEADRSAPTAAKTSDEFRVADYCTIVLAPKLAAELGLGVVQRVKLAVIEDRLIPGLKGCLRLGPTGAPMVSPEVTMVERTMLGHLDRDGEKVREALTSKQIDQFRQLRSSGKVAAIGVRVRPPASPVSPIYFEVLYTPYGEKGPVKQPIKETIVREGNKTVTKTEIHLEESHGDHKALAQIHSIAEALEVLGAQDAEVRGLGALWLLKIAKVEPADRPRVLAALKPLVDAPERKPPSDHKDLAARASYFDRGGRSSCLEAFCRWADREQTPTLLKIAHRPLSNASDVGVNQDSVGAALKTLLRLDPAAADNLVHERSGEFFFRTAATRALESLTAADGVPPETSAKLLTELKEFRTTVKNRPRAGEAQATPPERPNSNAPGSARGADAEEGDTASSRVAPGKRPPGMSAGVLRASAKQAEGSSEISSDQVLADLQSGNQGRLVRTMMQLQRTNPTQPDPAVAKALEAIALDNPNTALRVAALAALQNWGTAESIPALQRAAQDANRTIQIKAKQAVEAIRARK